MSLLGLLPQPIAVCAAGVVCARGRGWQGLGTALRDGAVFVSATGSGAKQAGVSDAVLAAGEDAALAKQRKQMSRAARLAAAALRDALNEAGWADGRQGLGAFLGVGSSSGAVAELDAVVRHSVQDGKFSLRRLGETGLAAAHPLFSFQLMNNFTLCHGAIAAGLGGPTSALFSRGAGTVTALAEAAWAILDGECTRALAGGADTALYPVTHAELLRDGLIAAGLCPGEGAAVLALAQKATEPLALLDSCAVLPCADPCLALDGRLADAAPAVTLAAVDAVLAACRATPPDAVVLLGFSAELRAALRARVAVAFSAAVVIDVVAALGDTLAGGPALAWAVGLDLIVSAAVGRVLALTVGLDGDVGAVGLRRRAP